jgi:hypothetical protein
MRQATGADARVGRSGEIVNPLLADGDKPQMSIDWNLRKCCAKPARSANVFGGSLMKPSTRVSGWRRGFDMPGIARITIR